MLSHDNLIQNAQAMNKVYKLKEASHSLISYLPLSHVAAQVNFLFEILFEILY